MLTLTNSDRTVLAQLATRNTLPVGAVIAVRVAHIIALWSFRQRSRKSLKQLSWQQLDDIGVSGDAARCEYKKVFWRP